MHALQLLLVLVLSLMLCCARLFSAAYILCWHLYVSAYPCHWLHCPWLLINIPSELHSYCGLSTVLKLLSAAACCLQDQMVRAFDVDNSRSLGFAEFSRLHYFLVNVQNSFQTFDR